MNWAIQQGGWAAHRFVAIDGRDKNQQFLPIPNLLKVGSKYPGVYRTEEAEPKRRTNRAELACSSKLETPLDDCSRNQITK